MGNEDKIDLRVDVGIDVRTSAQGRHEQGPDEEGRPGHGAPRRRGEAGEGRLGCIFWTLLLVVGIVVAWQMVPVKLRTAEFHDYMEDQANLAAASSAESLKKRVLERANELDLPVGPKNLTVSKGGDRIKMYTEYTIVVEFPLGFTYEWDFVHDVDRPIYYY